MAQLHAFLVVVQILATDDPRFILLRTIAEQDDFFMEQNHKDSRIRRFLGQIDQILKEGLNNYSHSVNGIGLRAGVAKHADVEPVPPSKLELVRLGVSLSDQLKHLVVILQRFPQVAEGVQLIVDLFVLHFELSLE